MPDDGDETASENEPDGPDARPAKQARLAAPVGQKAGKTRICQVDGCSVDLMQPHIKNYNRRNRVCEVHMKGLCTMVNGKPLRYCQQCHSFHPVDRFDGTKQSCRAKLEARAVHVKAAKEKQSMAQAAFRAMQQDVSSGAPQPYHSRARAALCGDPHLPPLVSRAIKMRHDGSDGIQGMEGVAMQVSAQPQYMVSEQMIPERMGAYVVTGAQMGTPEHAGAWAAPSSDPQLLVQLMQQHVAQQLHVAQAQCNMPATGVLMQQQELLCQLKELQNRQQELQFNQQGSMMQLDGQVASRAMQYPHQQMQMVKLSGGQHVLMPVQSMMQQMQMPLHHTKNEQLPPGMSRMVLIQQAQGGLSYAAVPSHMPAVVEASGQ